MYILQYNTSCDNYLIKNAMTYLQIKCKPFSLVNFILSDASYLNLFDLNVLNSSFTLLIVSTMNSCEIKSVVNRSFLLNPIIQKKRIEATIKMCFLIAVRSTYRFTKKWYYHYIEYYE